MNCLVLVSLMHDVKDKIVWLFDLDNTLHDAQHAAFPYIDKAMTSYIAQQLDVSCACADQLRREYWLRYGATLKGLVLHHGIDWAHFLRQTHMLPDLEKRLIFQRRQLQAIAHLPGEKWVYTNGPLFYARRVLKAAGALHLFNGIWAIENTFFYKQYHPKPDIGALRRLLTFLKVKPSRCVLVDDSWHNLESAKKLHMKTVWMYSFLKQYENQGVKRKGLRNWPRSIDAAVDRLDAIPCLTKAWF